MKKPLSRRKMLTHMSMGLGALGMASCKTKNISGQEIILPNDDQISQLARPVTAITLGAGNRGNVYGDYGVEYPSQLNIIGVAEPIAIRNKRYCAKHQIKAENSFETWEDVFERPKFADAIIITTPDDLHYGPCMAALKKRLRYFIGKAHLSIRTGMQRYSEIVSRDRSNRRSMPCFKVCTLFYRIERAHTIGHVGRSRQYAAFRTHPAYTHESFFCERQLEK